MFLLDTDVISELRKAGDGGARLRTWVEERVLPEFSDRVLLVDAAVALRRARLHVRDPRLERDAYLTATALVHGMTVVTRNRADFASAGVGIS